MRDLQDTKPISRKISRGADRGGAPPRLLFWGVILFFLLLVGGLIAVVLGFREVLQPAQQQRVIDQFPFMRMFRNPTPVGGVFPTLAPAVDEDAALALLDMPLDIAPGISATAPPLPTLSTPLPLPTATPTATRPPPTKIPTVSPAAPALASATPAATALPAAARISGIVHQQQTWNNCGPATITMALSYYGWQRDQAFAASVLKPNREDKNVSPHELAQFVNQESQIKAISRMGGTLDLLKRLIANGFPVVIETGAMFEAYDWIGHYRVLIAYDDAFQLMYFFDSFLGVGTAAQGVAESYERVHKDWGDFNRSFIVVYEPQREALLRELMGDYWHAERSAELAFEAARLAARREPQNGFAWFNMGSSLAALGRYEEAAAAYDQAHRSESLPWRIHWYQFGAFEAYFHVGRYDDVLSLVRITQNNAREIEETYYWRGRVRQAQGSAQQAATNYRQALGYNPNYAEARQALESLN